MPMSRQCEILGRNKNLRSAGTRTETRCKYLQNVVILAPFEVRVTRVLVQIHPSERNIYIYIYNF